MKRLFLLSIAIVILVLPCYAGASSVLDVADSIFGSSGITYSFTADQTPTKYQVTLTDFEFPVAFDFLGVAIARSTDKVAELLKPGITTFDATLGAQYFAILIGDAGEYSPGGSAAPVEAGSFGLNITAIPIPQTLTLLGTGLFAVILLRRRAR